MTIQTYTVGTSVGNAYVSGGNTAVTFLSLCNYSSNPVTVNLYIVPATATADTTNIVYSNLQLTANDTYQLYLGGEKLLLSNGDTIQVSANTATSVTAVTSYTSI
jgi:hypothetical protein